MNWIIQHDDTGLFFAGFDPDTAAPQWAEQPKQALKLTDYDMRRICNLMPGATGVRINYP
jgi:hypothetical protein